MVEKIKNKIKEFVYKHDEFSFAQRKSNRKWYGGEWNKLYHEKMCFSVWVQGKPADYLLKEFKIVETENWD